MTTLSLLPPSTMLPLVVVLSILWAAVRFWPQIKEFAAKTKASLPEESFVSTTATSENPENFVSLAKALKTVSEHVNKVGRRDDKEAVESLSKLLLRSPDDTVR